MLASASAHGNAASPHGNAALLEDRSSAQSLVTQEWSPLSSDQIYLYKSDESKASPTMAVLADNNILLVSLEYTNVICYSQKSAVMETYELWNQLIQWQDCEGFLTGHGHQLCQLIQGCFLDHFIVFLQRCHDALQRSMWTETLEVQTERLYQVFL